MYIIGKTGTRESTLIARPPGFQGLALLDPHGNLVEQPFVDPSTLRVTLPLLPMGAARLTLTNPNGESYSLDNALTVH